jgi:ATP-binding cassette subfamily F protein 3
MILDEPTNHLDIDSRDALVQCPERIRRRRADLVSHDRHLIEACADRLWLVGDGTVKNFDGDMDDYRDFVLGRDKPAQRGKAEADAAGKADERKSAAAKRQALGPLKQKLNLAEARIAKLTGLIEKVDGALANGAFAREPEKALQLSRQRGELTEALAAAEEEWLMLSEELESA